MVTAELDVAVYPTGKTRPFHSDGFWHNFFNQADKTRSEGEHESKSTLKHLGMSSPKSCCSLQGGYEDMKQLDVPQAGALTPQKPPRVKTVKEECKNGRMC